MTVPAHVRASRCAQSGTKLVFKPVEMCAPPGPLHLRQSRPLHCSPAEGVLKARSVFKNKKKTLHNIPIPSILSLPDVEKTSFPSAPIPSENMNQAWGLGIVGKPSHDAFEELWQDECVCTAPSFIACTNRSGPDSSLLETRSADNNKKKYTTNSRLGPTAREGL